MLRLRNNRSADPYRKYQSRWALWKVTLAGLIFAALCVAAIYAINLESYAPGETPRQTTGAVPQGN